MATPHFLPHCMLTVPWCVSQICHTLIKKKKMRLALVLTQKAPLWGPGSREKVWLTPDSILRDGERKLEMLFQGDRPMRQPPVINPQGTKSLWFQCQLQGRTCSYLFVLLQLTLPRLPDKVHCHSPLLPQQAEAGTPERQVFAQKQRSWKKVIWFLFLLFGIGFVFLLRNDKAICSM